MKNIFVALALFAALGVSAQAKKNVNPVQKTEVVSQKLTPEATAERDMKALNAFIPVDESMKANISKIFITKYRTKEETNLSPERLTALSTYVESTLLSYIGDANLAKLKSNTKLYNQLVK
jgi:hypothetical protein